MITIPMLKQCCCGCSLKKGTIVIGALGIIHGIAQIIEASVEGVVVSTYKFYNGSRWEFVPALTITMGCLIIVLSIALIVGASLEEPRAVLAWVLGRAVVTVLTVVFVPISIAYHLGEPSGRVLAPLFFVLGCAELATDVYFLLVVFSFYRIIAGNAPQGVGV